MSALPKGFKVRSRAEWLAMATDKDPAGKGQINEALRSLGVAANAYFSKSLPDRAELIVEYQRAAGYDDAGNASGGEAAEAPPQEEKKAAAPAKTAAAPAPAPAAKKLASGPSPAAAAAASAPAPAAKKSDADTQSGSTAALAASVSSLEKRVLELTGLVAEQGVALANMAAQLRDSQYMLRVMVMSFEATSANVNDPEMLSLYGKLQVEEPPKGNG